jgi:hypothetical protein
MLCAGGDGVGECFSRSSRSSAATMNGPGYVGESLSTALGERLFSSLLGGVSDELRHGLTSHRGRPSYLPVELRIEAQAPHAQHCITEMPTRITSWVWHR